MPTLVKHLQNTSASKLAKDIAKTIASLRHAYENAQERLEEDTHWACKTKRKPVTIREGGLATPGNHDASEILNQSANLARLLDVLRINEDWHVGSCDPTQTDTGPADLVLHKDSEFRVYEITDTGGSGLGTKVGEQKRKLKKAVEEVARTKADCATNIQAFSVIGAQRRGWEEVSNGTYIKELIDLAWTRPK